MPIQILSEYIASQIAAGEVVERPVSVVKELMENALDAGASSISVAQVGGGLRLIRVADDGYGFLAEDVEIAFARYSTSKLSTIDDLMALQTLGFRGEALASIAAVSRVTLVTRAVDEETGTRLRIEGGQIIDHEIIGAPQGTVVTVENLFYNVPARLKFLKTDKTERSPCRPVGHQLRNGLPACSFQCRAGRPRGCSVLPAAASYMMYWLAPGDFLMPNRC